MEKQKAYVNLEFDAQTNSLPREGWQEFEIHELKAHQTPEIAAISMALEASELPPPKWPLVAYATTQQPVPGCCMTRYSLEIQPQH